MLRLLRDNDAVPDGQLLGESTKSTQKTKLTELRKELARKQGNTVEKIKHEQGYRLDEGCPVPEGLEKEPTLYQYFNELLGSTALSAAQWAQAVYPGKNLTEEMAKSRTANAASRLRHDYGLSTRLHSTGFHAIRTESRDPQPPAIFQASAAMAQPGAPAEPDHVITRENKRREELVENMHRLKALRLNHSST
jgi:hypothetical protein